MRSAPSFMSKSMAPSIQGSAFPTTNVNLPKTLLCPADIMNSIAAYESLLEAAKAYRNQLAALSQSANAFGAALEACTRVKGVDEAAEGLSNVAGLQYLVANHQSVLSDTIYRSFEIPLRENLENFMQTTSERREEYKSDLAAKMKLLAKREKDHLALARKKQRSLDKFREALADLTMLADDIEKLKSDYFYNALDYHCETWSRVALRSNIVCKAELALYSGVAQKADHLEVSLVGTPDPWTQDDRLGDEIFQILPPQEILARPQSPSHDLTGGLFQSLLGAVAEQDSPGPPSKIHAKTMLGESSFFGLPRETRGVVAMVRSAPESVAEAEDLLATPESKHGSPSSPYQDAEEENDHTIVSGSVHSYSAQSVSPQRPSSTPAGTPLRPSSKRSNGYTAVTPSRPRHDSSIKLFNPRPASKSSANTEIRAPSEADPWSDNGIHSPDIAEGQKHSQFYLVKSEAN